MSSPRWEIAKKVGLIILSIIGLAAAIAFAIWTYIYLPEFIDTYMWEGYGKGITIGAFVVGGIGIIIFIVFRLKKYRRRVKQ